jgi:hypothetical protein
MDLDWHSCARVSDGREITIEEEVRHAFWGDLDVMPCLRGVSASASDIN